MQKDEIKSVLLEINTKLGYIQRESSDHEKRIRKVEKFVYIGIGFLTFLDSFLIVMKIFGLK